MFHPLFIISLLLFSLSEPIFASSSFCKFNISEDYLQNGETITLHCLLPTEYQCSWKRGDHFILIGGRYQFLNKTPLSNSDDYLFDCSIVINQPNVNIDQGVFTCEGLEGRTKDNDENPQPKQCTIEYKPKITVKTSTITTARLPNSSVQFKTKPMETTTGTISTLKVNNYYNTYDSTYQNSSLLHPRESANVDSDLKTICSLAFDSGRNGQIVLVILGIAVFSAGAIIGAVAVIVIKKVCLKPKPRTLPIKFENRTYFDPKCDFISSWKNDHII